MLRRRRSIPVKGQVIARNEEISDFEIATPASMIGRIDVGGKLITWHGYINQVSQ